MADRPTRSSHTGGLTDEKEVRPTERSRTRSERVDTRIRGQAAAWLHSDRTEVAAPRDADEEPGEKVTIKTRTHDGISYWWRQDFQRLIERIEEMTHRAIGEFKDQIIDEYKNLFGPDFQVDVTTD